MSASHTGIHRLRRGSMIQHGLLFRRAVMRADMDCGCCLLKLSGGEGPSGWEIERFCTNSEHRRMRPWRQGQAGA